MSEYVPTIGLEIHAELRTKTKMFCDSPNNSEERRPNVNVCPVCLAHPGTLPVINKEAVRHVLRVGTALQGNIADYTEFDRKNYFYPDLPKGYQISQYGYPLVSGGTLRGVRITRVHLEEDTASSVHLPAPAGVQNAGGQAGEEGRGTLVDFNRAGVPLMELVTEPDIKSAEEAGAFARELQILLRTLGASEANMEKGEMRVEANVSVARPGGTLGTKVEVKNLNSFRAMERAVEYEIKRQSELLAEGKAVRQETRGWDESKQATFSQRAKEGSADYRYFPDPDLPSLVLSELPEFSKEALRASLPELPGERRARFVSLGAKPEDADLYVRDERLGSFFDESVSEAKRGGVSYSATTASNYIANDLVKIVRDKEKPDSATSHEIPISVEYFNKIIALLIEKKISSRGAKDLLQAADRGTDPLLLASEMGILAGMNDDVGPVLREIIEKNPSAVADYRGGKEAALEFLVGQAMKRLRGATDPVALREALKKLISP
jgi:aspartyl-tRNA(Asn)/glutamyl-tRNA(Gln) amidotransferase subunit B